MIIVHPYLIGSNFIGRITIRGDSIRTNDNRRYISGFHQCSYHVVADQSGRNFLVH